MNKKQEKEYIDNIRSLPDKLPKDYIMYLLNVDNLCNVSLNIISAIVDKYYRQGDELNFKEIIKKTIHCLPLHIFRYLMLFVADKETKMKIYAYAVEKEREDLLPSIKGLGSKEYTLISEYYNQLSSKNPKTDELLVKQLNKAIKKEKVKKDTRDKNKYYAVKIHRSLKRKSSK